MVLQACEDPIGSPGSGIAVRVEPFPSGERYASYSSVPDHVEGSGTTGILRFLPSSLC